MPRHGIDGFHWTDPELDDAVAQLRQRHAGGTFQRADIERVSLAMTGRATRTLRDRLLATGRIVPCGPPAGHTACFRLAVALALTTSMLTATAQAIDASQIDGGFDSFAQWDLMRGDIGNPQEG